MGKTRPTTYVTLIIQLKISYSVGKSKQSELLHFSTRTFIVLQNQTQSYIFLFFHKVSHGMLFLQQNLTEKGEKRSMKKFLSKSLSSVVFFALAIIFTFTTVAPGQASAATFKGIPFEQQQIIKDLLEKNERVISILINSFVEEDNSYTFDVKKLLSSVLLKKKRRLLRNS